MFRMMLLVAALAGSARGLWDVYESCLKENAASTHDNHYMLGTWYEVYKFGPTISAIPGCGCAIDEVWNPSPEQLQEYRDYFSDKDVPAPLDDDPVMMRRTDAALDETAIVAGLPDAKFYLVGPKELQFFYGYDVRVYKKVTEEFMLVSKCSMRGNEYWLWARRSDHADQEIQAVIDTIEEVKNYKAQRYCTGDC